MNEDDKQYWINRILAAVDITVDEMTNQEPIDDSDMMSILGQVCEHLNDKKLEIYNKD